MQSTPETHSTQAPGNALHAQVIPSFVLPAVARDLECSIGLIAPRELLCWERVGNLTELNRQKLRAIIIKRLRPRAEWLWSQPIGVHLPPKWRHSFPKSEVKAIEAVQALYPDIPFESLKLGQFRKGFKRPLDAQFSLLARLEAMYWQPLVRPTRHPPSPPHSSFSSRVLLSEIGDEVMRVIGQPWIDLVSPDDLRFGFRGARSLKEWFGVQLDERSVSRDGHAMLHKLDKASRMTAAEEAADVIAHLAQECAPRSQDAIERWQAIFSARLISESGRGRTLAEVGETFNLTRERVRVICGHFEGLIEVVPVTLPALDRVLAAAARIAPMTVSEANVQLAKFIGSRAGIESLVAWAKSMDRPGLVVECTRTSRRIRGQMVELLMLERVDAEQWSSKLVGHVCRDTMVFGCTNILRIAGLLAIKEEAAPGLSVIESALEGCAHFRWLDKDAGWFTLGETDICSIASRVKKIMAVAHDHVGADQIASALASDDMLIYKNVHATGLAVPPVHVLRELFKGWSWLKVVQKGRFAPAAGFDSSEALSEAEKIAVQVIERHDGVACRFEIRAAIEDALHLTNEAVSAMLGSSPIFIKLEFGLYSLIGRLIGDQALMEARRRSRINLSDDRFYPEGLGTSEFVLVVSAALQRNEQYRVPKRFLQTLADKTFSFQDKAGTLQGTARINPSGTLTGLNRVFRPNEGDLFRLTVGANGITVEHKIAGAHESVLPVGRAHSEPEVCKG